MTKLHARVRFVRPYLVVAVVLLLLGTTGRARADEAPSTGVSAEIGFATAYVFRGWNVFQEDEQMDPALLLAPGVSWSVFDTGLTIGYWGAFQISGDNIDALNDAGLGSEQDVYVLYEYGLPFGLGVSAGITAYIYPEASEAVTGAAVPFFIEPSVGLSYSYGVDFGLSVSYLLGVQDEPGIRGISYLYVNPTVSRGFELLAWLGLDVSVGYGFKLFEEGNEGADNVHDVLVTLALPVAVRSGVSLVPNLGLAWTNREDTADRTYGFADGLVVWGGVKLAVDL